MGRIDLLNGYEVIIVSLGGVLCIYIGYRLLMIGTNRPFKIFSDLKGWRYKAANLAPGLFFATLGAAVLCSPTITTVISILQNETFINTYATKLILDELRQHNKESFRRKLEDHVPVRRGTRKILPTKADSFSAMGVSGKALVTSNGLRLRKQPGMHYQVIGSLRKGAVIRVKEARGPWMRVSTDEIVDGWVHGDYVKRLEYSGTSEATETALFVRAKPVE
jgi:uncharacterized protein YgiM (DUF1202 family)